ncbi:unnamed protein product [Bursaphelenchus xylophilus]|uniref:(pine wood nematode) hypothetical protein n=1 Tax=Bursaphelenchus xylophilus TaxID=6326 RepID=A0A7I8WLI8_BURXY|nr:unnamed protein product [Bursaphelenchus xylophilus]CAG9105334.1 unnamed protein product [Bursaphelenchus xylophilus]
MMQHILSFMGHANQPEYQLLYLNLRGKGEPIRLFFKYFNIEFTDEKQDYNNYKNVKDTPPLPKMPRLIVNGEFEVNYTSCILQYLAEKHGLLPKTAEDRALANVWGVRLNDYLNQMRPWFYCFLYDNLRPLLEERIESVYKAAVLEDFAVMLQRQLETTKSGFLVGNELSYIDFYAAHLTDLCLTYGPKESLKDFPVLLQHHKKIYSLPELQEYLKNRPEHDF